MAEEIPTVLIGTSLDAASDVVVRAGVAWARAAGAQVYLAHAFTPPSGYVGEIALQPPTDALLAAEQEALREELLAQAQREALPGDLAGWTLRSGAPHRVLCNLAIELGAGLLVIGATAGGRLHRLGNFGSSADRIVRRACCPVLVLRGEPRIPPARVLAPVDLSPLSGEALHLGLARLSDLGGTPEVEALFVLGVLQRQVAPQFNPEQIDRFAAEELDRFVAKHAGAAAATLRRKVRVGHPREQILAEAAESRPDLLLLGTHGLGGFDRLVIGSVAADLAREASCSLLVVPPAAARAAES